MKTLSARILVVLVPAVLLLASAAAQGAIVPPVLRSTGSASQAGGVLDISATAQIIELNLAGTEFIDIPDAPFSLSATLTGLSGTQGLYDGSLQVGGGSLLSASFSGLRLIPFPGFGDSVSVALTGAVHYLGGSLVTAGTDGSLDGSMLTIFLGGEPFSGIAGDFAAAQAILKVSQVSPPTAVPLPAALWLFCPVMGFLLGVRRRVRG